MSLNPFKFSSFSVTEGHPDKLCDSLSDCILDAYLEQDATAKVSCNILAKTNTIFVVGEITSQKEINIQKVIRDRLKEIGYDDEAKGFNYESCDIIINITKQSTDITNALQQGLTGDTLCAGDQGLMFGYATNETPEKIPLSHKLATQLANKLTEQRKNNGIKWLRPDGRTEVTLEYKKQNGIFKPTQIEHVSVIVQHNPNISKEEIENEIKNKVIKPVLPSELVKDTTCISINPQGQPSKVSTGMTGKQIIADSYGGWGAHGGGAFSGKDPTKMDRSGAYMARWIAKSLVCAGLCEKVLVQVSYSIGKNEPCNIMVDSYGTVTKKGKSDAELEKIVRNNFDLRPGMIIKALNLMNIKYKPTSIGGHFGRVEEGFPWEQAKQLKV